MIVVRKKDNTLRFCVDYKRLNEVSEKGTYPLHRIDACLDTMNGSRWFFTFDLRSGYHQVLMNEESRDKMTFVMREGTFKFLIMPFSLNGAPSLFQSSRLQSLKDSSHSVEIRA